MTSTGTTRSIRRAPRIVLAAVGLGAAATALTAAVLTAHDAHAAQDTSTAYGISATGVDPVSAQPSVSSSGAVKADSAGAVAGKAGTFTASGLSVRAGAGLAEASVASVTVGGVTIGPVGAKCSQGTTTYSGGGPAQPARNVRVSYGGGAGATITVLGANTKPAETITVAVVKCGTGTPPAPPTSSKPRPTTSKPHGTVTRPPTRTERPAPRPVPRDGHHAVTG